MKVIGLSGAQGAGKSTLLKELMERGWKLDQFRVSRAVQAQLGWENLDRVMESPSTMMEFQNEVFRQKYKNDAALMEEPTGDVILTERTFADIIAYTMQWTWKFVDQDKLEFNDGMAFLTPFTRDCARAQAEIYSGTILLPYMEHMVWEDDANRAKLSDVHTVFEDIERFLELKLPITHKRVKLLGKTVEERADQVEQFLKSL